jgi:hypothetical protein
MRTSSIIFYDIERKKNVIDFKVTATTQRTSIAKLT